MSRKPPRPRIDVDLVLDGEEQERHRTAATTTDDVTWTIPNSTISLANLSGSVLAGPGRYLTQHRGARHDHLHLGPVW